MGICLLIIFLPLDDISYAYRKYVDLAIGQRISSIYVPLTGWISSKDDRNRFEVGPDIYLTGSNNYHRNKGLDAEGGLFDA